MYTYRFVFIIRHHILASFFPPFYLYDGDIAQLARASALQAEGQGFESPYLHKPQSVTGKTAEDLDIRKGRETK